MSSLWQTPDFSTQLERQYQLSIDVRSDSCLHECKSTEVPKCLSGSLILASENLCGECGAENLMTNEFCGKCGRRLVRQTSTLKSDGDDRCVGLSATS